MQNELLNLSVKALLNMLILESKKFIWALELGAAVSDLEDIRERMRSITDMIHKKENLGHNEDLNTQKTVESQVKLRNSKPHTHGL